MRWMVAIAAAISLAAHGKEPGTVEGTVVSIADGRGVAGATVVLQGLDATGNPPQPESYVTRTNSDGHFRVEAVEPGRYEVRPQREGFTAFLPGVSPAKAYARLTVQAGQSATVISRLVPLGAISGRIVDQDGDPVSRARVEAVRFVYTDGKRELKSAGGAGSDDRGNFRIFGLPPGRYYLQAAQPLRTMGLRTAYLKIRGSKPSISFVPTWYGGATDAGQATPVDLAPGAELRDMQIQLLSSGAYTIRVNLGGEASTSERLMLMVGPASGSGVFTGGNGGRGKTWPFSNLAPGKYVVEARDDEHRLFARQIVEVVNGDLDITITPLPEIQIEGVMRLDVEGRTSIAENCVTLESEQPMFSRVAVCKPNGSFQIGQIQAVPYRVHVTAPPGTYVESIRYGDAVLAQPLIDLARPAERLTVILGTGGATIEGTVAAGDGASVVLVPDGAQKGWTDLLRTTVTGKEGNFELHDIAPGDYRLFAWDDADPGAVLDEEFRRPFADRGAPIHVEPNGIVAVRVEALSVIPGK